MLLVPNKLPDTVDPAFGPPAIATVRRILRPRPRLAGLQPVHARGGEALDETLRSGAETSEGPGKALNMKELSGHSSTSWACDASWQKPQPLPRLQVPSCITSFKVQGLVVKCHALPISDAHAWSLERILT